MDRYILSILRSHHNFFLNLVRFQRRVVWKPNAGVKKNETVRGQLLLACLLLVVYTCPEPAHSIVRVIRDSELTRALNTRLSPSVV